MGFQDSSADTLFGTAISLLKKHPNEELRQTIHALDQNVEKPQYELPVPEFFDEFYSAAHSIKSESPSRIHRLPLGKVMSCLVQFSDHIDNEIVENNLKIDVDKLVWFIKAVTNQCLESEQRVGVADQLKIFTQSYDQSIVDSLYELAIISRFAARGADKSLLHGEISVEDSNNLIKSWHRSIRGFDVSNLGKNVTGETYYFWTLAAWEATIRHHPTASRLSKIVLGELFSEGPNIMYYVRSKIVKQPPHSKATQASNLGRQVGAILTT